MRILAERISPFLALTAALGLLLACDATTGGTDPAVVGGSGGTGGQQTTGGGGSTGGSTGTGTLTDDDGDGYSEAEGDCHDGNPQIHPGAEEICDDGIDNNCNGAEGAAEPDGDGDGFGPCQGDCDDSDPNVSPAAGEIAGDGIDNNCDGIIDGDYDGDGYTAAGGDCHDYDPTVYPGAPEDCHDGIDNDCNGYADGAEPDVDSDGYGPCDGDCAEGDPSIGPSQPEIPGDGIDNNCDNLVDLDLDGDGWTVPNGDCNDSDPTINPAALESCSDGIDNNCNGITDTDCLSPCDLAALTRSSVGCEYFALDTDNADASHDAMPYAVVVSNTETTAAAYVEVQVRSGGSWQVVQSATVPPLDLHQFTLPDRHIDHTGINLAGAYRIVSDLPVIAYQFQPVDGVSSYSSDASLLLPTSSLDTIYHVVGLGGTVGGYMPQIAIAVAHDNTQITVTTTTATMAGGGVPALSPGVPYTFPQTFNAGDHIQIASTGGNEGFTGSVVQATQPVSVFSAHEAMYIPSPCCADHLEEQMFGLQTWGHRYVAARIPVRNTGGSVDPIIWQIYASEGPTTVDFVHSPGVTFSPALPPGNQITLQAGEVALYSVGGTTAAPGDFIVDADQPIHVMGYMTSSDSTNAAPQHAGDPAMMQMIPVEQLLDSYVVLVPPNWTNDALIVLKPVGSTVTLDGAAIAQGSFITINDGTTPVEWEVARIATADGVHTLTGTAAFGVIVVGYDAYDSYAYPGGLDQQIINPIN